MEAQSSVLAGQKGGKEHGGSQNGVCKRMTGMGDAVGSFTTATNPPVDVCQAGH